MTCWALPEAVIRNSICITEVANWTVQTVRRKILAQKWLVLATSTRGRLNGNCCTVVTFWTDAWDRVILNAVLSRFARPAIIFGLCTLLRIVESLWASFRKCCAGRTKMTSRAYLIQVVRRSSTEVAEISCIAYSLDFTLIAILAFRTKNTVVCWDHHDEFFISICAIWAIRRCWTSSRTVAIFAWNRLLGSKAFAVVSLWTFLASVRACSCFIGSRFASYHLFWFLWTIISSFAHASCLVGRVRFNCLWFAVVASITDLVLTLNNLHC